MNELLSRLDIQLPIIQAPMAGVQDWELCAAVSKAGGLGSLPCALLSPAQIEEQVTNIRAKTNKPFNLNFFCHEMPDVDTGVMHHWQSQFSDEYLRYDIPQEKQSSGKLRLPFDAETASLLEDIRPAVVSFHFGLPDTQLLEQVRASGAVILSSATTLEEAKWLEQNGADAVILQGVEAGGHRGMFLQTSLEQQLPAFELLAKCRDKISCPIILSGGISTPQNVQQAFTSGASLVQVGTAYLLCNEAKTSPIHRQALEQSDGSNTAITNVFSGRPARGIINGMINRLGAINTLAPPFPYAALATGALRQAAEEQGINDYTPLWSGTNTAGCKKTSAADITLNLSSSVISSP